MHTENLRLGRYFNVLGIALVISITDFEVYSYLQRIQWYRNKFTNLEQKIILKYTRIFSWKFQFPQPAT